MPTCRRCGEPGARFGSLGVRHAHGPTSHDFEAAPVPFSRTPLGADVRLSWDPGDPWSSCMGWLFAIAGELDARGEDVPAEWYYRPAPDDGRDPDAWESGPCAAASVEDLHRAGRLLWRVRARCIAAGRDY